MKAYMSDAALRYSGKGETWDRSEAAQVATFEAQHILAETETGSEVPALGLRVWEPHTPLASALADALRAFVVSR